jgi:hypothetical protein
VLLHALGAVQAVLDNASGTASADAHLRSSAALALAHASLPLADAPGYELAAQLPDPCAAVAACMLLLQGRDPKASRRLPAVAAS